MGSKELVSHMYVRGNAANIITSCGTIHPLPDGGDTHTPDLKGKDSSGFSTDYYHLGFKKKLTHFVALSDQKQPQIPA